MIDELIGKILLVFLFMLGAILTVLGAVIENPHTGILLSILGIWLMSLSVFEKRK